MATQTTGLREVPSARVADPRSCYMTVHDGGGEDSEADSKALSILPK